MIFSLAPNTFPQRGTHQSINYVSHAVTEIHQRKTNNLASLLSAPCHRGRTRINPSIEKSSKARSETQWDYPCPIHGAIRTRSYVCLYERRIGQNCCGPSFSFAWKCQKVWTKRHPRTIHGYTHNREKTGTQYANRNVTHYGRGTSGLKFPARFYAFTIFSRFRPFHSEILPRRVPDIISHKWIREDIVARILTTQRRSSGYVYPFKVSRSSTNKALV